MPLFPCKYPCHAAIGAFEPDSIAFGLFRFSVICTAGNKHNSAFAIKYRGQCKVLCRAFIILRKQDAYILPALSSVLSPIDDELPWRIVACHLNISVRITDESDLIRKDACAGRPARVCIIMPELIPIRSVIRSENAADLCIRNALSRENDEISADKAHKLQPCFTINAQVQIFAHVS